MSQEKRIPAKGTAAYHEYWRDRHLLNDLRLMQDRLLKVRTSNPQRQQGFVDAAEGMDKVIDSLAAAHATSYTS